MSAEANGLNGVDRANDRVYVEALCAAVAALGDALAAERERVARAEQRIDQLFAELTDARAAERISAESAAGLRHQLDLLRARQPWWRRRFH
jgi:vacuolar-type H+-ATPase subunit E/Vma4